MTFLLTFIRRSLGLPDWGRSADLLVSPLFWAPPLLLCIFVFIADTQSFLVGHVIAEFFTVMIGWAIFAMVWKTQALVQHGLMLTLGCGLFWAGAIDLVHLMAYKDMDLLSIGGGNASTATWVSARMLQVCTFLAAPLLIRWQLRFWTIFLGFGLIAVGILAAIFLEKFPDTFIDGQGLTAFKVAMEFTIMALAMLAIGVVAGLPAHILRTEDKPLIILSLLVMIGMEISLSFYTNLFGNANLVGHLLKIWSYWLLFEAAVQINLIKPNTLLRRLSAVVTQNPLAVVITDRNGKVEFVNAQFEADTGYSQAEIEGQSIGILQSSEMSTEIVDAMWHTIGKGEPWRGYFRNVRKDGTLYWDSSIISSIRDEHGRIISYMAIKEDVTQKRQVEEFLLDTDNAVNKMLVGSLEAMVDLQESRDPYTAGHSRNVAHIALAIAEEMGMPRSQAEGLRMAAMIHDIGKMRVPMDILNKPGKLTPQEFEIIKQHPQSAYDVLKSIPFPWDVPKIVLAHHEKWDGTGYPNGWAKEKIPLESQILSVADVLDAVTAHRPYRPSLGLDAAFDMVEAGRGTSFNPAVVEATLRIRAKIASLLSK